MERLTVKNMKFTQLLTCGKDDVCNNRCGSCEHLTKALGKLARFEDLYEQHILFKFMFNRKNSKIICKKILPHYFSDVKKGVKNFEIRKDEDNIQVGDVIILEEWTGRYYTDKRIKRKVKYVLRDIPEYGLSEGYCIIGW